MVYYGRNQLVEEQKIESTMEEALKAPKEIWMVEHVYKKLVSRSKL